MLRRHLIILLKRLDDQLKTLYERVNNIDSRIPIIIGWCETLRENQNILQGDLEKVFYGAEKKSENRKKQKERQIRRKTV